MVSKPEFLEEAHSRHEERVERREGRREKRHARRVRFGEIVSQEELDSGEAVLDEVEPEDGPEDESEATEPWGWADKPMPGSVRERLRAYGTFLADWRAEHHDDPTGEESPEPEETETSE